MVSEAADSSAVATGAYGRIVGDNAICDCRAAFIAEYSTTIAKGVESIRADDAIRDYRVAVFQTGNSAALVFHNVICDDTVFYCWAASITVNCAPVGTTTIGNG